MIMIFTLFHFVSVHIFHRKWIFLKKLNNSLETLSENKITEYLSPT